MADLPVLCSGEFDPAAIEETAAAAAESARVAKETAAYVMANFKKLLGCEIPVEITKIQILPLHNCLIVEDLLLVSFVEAKALLEQIDE